MTKGKKMQNTLNRWPLAVGLILAQSGEFALVLFSLANKSKLLSDLLFQQLLC
jgi:Kef-type K+ transport system membrane component KefB